MRKKLLICDLDNTLYDWVTYFVDAFYALADEVVRITNCDREQLLDDFREVHRMHHDAEHPFAVLETRTIATMFPGKSRAQIAQILDPAFHAFNSRRKQSLALYAGVRETLDALRQNNVTMVAHTESKLYAVVDRLSRLDLVDYFSHIYCRERSNSLHPNGEGAWDYLSNFPMEKIIELSHHQRKPNQHVLLEICTREGVSPENSAYVGDSMSRDVLMAKRAHVFAIWAKYGTNHKEGDYQKLVRVSHWTDEDIKREKTLIIEVSAISPDYVAENSFTEVITALSG
jgi:phosphoglycolate phosphatase